MPFLAFEAKDGFAAGEFRVGTNLSVFRCERITLGGSMQMCSDLVSVGSVACAPSRGGKFPRLGEKAQDRQIGLRNLSIQVLAFAHFHLPAEQCMHSGFSIDGDCVKLGVGCRSWHLSYASLGGQQLSCNPQMQRGEETPGSRLRRQLRHMENPGRYRLALQETKVIQVGKAHLAGQDQPQKETKHRHEARLSLEAEAFFDQLLEADLFQHCRYLKQPAVSSLWLKS